MAISHYLKSIRSKLGHELVVIPAVSVSIVDHQGRMLLGKDAQRGVWTLPGGAIDPLEQPADAAMRECFEETGFLVQLTGLIGVFSGPEFLIQYPNGDEAYYVTTAFRGIVVHGVRGTTDGEMSEIGYFSQAECEGLNLSLAAKLLAGTTFAASNCPYFHPASWRPFAGSPAD